MPLLQGELVPAGPIDGIWVIRLVLGCLIAVVGWVARQQAAEKAEARKEVLSLVGTITELTGGVREMKDAVRLGFEDTRRNKDTLERIERKLEQALWDRSRGT